MDVLFASPALRSFFGLTPGTALVRRSATTSARLLLRRRLTPADALVALSWLDLTIAEPTWLSPDRSDAQRVLLIRPIEHERRALAVTIKWVPARRARSGDDEFWIVAVMCPGQARLRRFQRTGRLHAVG